MGQPVYSVIETVCIYCGVGCGIDVQLMDGKISGVLPAISHPISQGKLCIKGWHAADFVDNADRLRTPLIRRNGELEPATWSQALDLIGERLAAIVDETGPDSIGLLSSAKCSNEENYLLQKLARGVIGTNNVDHCARL